jgi:hypothetical protein
MFCDAKHIEPALRDCLEFNVEGTEKKDNFNINSKEME